MTRVGAPNPMLLAMARGVKPSQPRRITWFMLGTLVGGLVVWCATSDVRADVYASRVWTADVLRSLRGVPSGGAEEATPSRIEPSPASPPASAAVPSFPPSATPPQATAAAPPSAPATGTTAKDVPTVDVTALPRTPAPDAPRPPADPAAHGASPETAAPAPAGGPALPNAPGPR